MLTALLATLTGLVPATPQDEAARTLALLRTPERALTLPGKHAQLVLPLLQSYADLLGWKLVLEPGLAAALAELGTGLSVPAEIARDDVQPFVQYVARSAGLSFRFEAQSADPQLRVERSARDKPLAAPIAIPPTLLPAWSNHPAFVLSVEFAHAREGSAELCERLRTLLANSASRTDISAAESGALQLSGSSAILEFVADALRDSATLAQPLDSATFPADPNTPAGKVAAALPASLLLAFPKRDVPLVLRTGEAPTRELETCEAFSRWSTRPMLFVGLQTLAALDKVPSGADDPKSVPPEWAHEFIAGMLADAGCALAPLPARRPVLWAIEGHPESAATALDPAGIPTIGLADLAAVAHLAATRFQAFVRLPKPDAELLRRINELQSPDPRAPFWITQLDDPQVFSVIGTPRAITSAVLALKLTLAPPKPR